MLRPPSDLSLRCDAGSGFQNLVSALYPQRLWGNVWLMALAAYFDASGHEADQKCVVVAGFVSSVEVWAELETLWTERLGKEGVKYFHAGEFAHSTGQFDGWRGDTARRNALTGDLMEILKPRVFRKFGHVVIREALGEMSGENKEKFLVTAYSLTGRSCAADLRKYLAREKWQTAPELIFEDGDIGKGKLRDTLLRDGFAEPLFKPKKDRVLKSGLTELGVVPLQTADWLANEMFQAIKQNRRDRWPMKEFETTPGRLGVYTSADVKALDTEMNTPLDRIMKPIEGSHFFVNWSEGE
jgi:hypothetical protein